MGGQLWQLETLLLQRDTYMNYSRPLSTASGAQWSQNLGAGVSGAVPAASASRGGEDENGGAKATTWGGLGMRERRQIGRASCRERVCLYV